MAFSEPDNITGVIDLFEYANSVSDNTFGVGIVVAFYMVIFLYLNHKGENAGDCMIVAGFASTIFAIFMFLAGLIVDKHLFIVIILTALPAVWSYWNKSR